MDWLSIVIAILVFVLPVLFERDKKKKQRGRWKEADLPDREGAREFLETKDVQREFAPVEGRDLTGEPYRREEAEPEGMSWDVTDVSDHDVPTVRPASSADVYGKRQQAPPVSAASAVPPVHAVSAVRRKRRFNARDMVIYSEIMHPKYLESQGKE